MRGDPEMDEENKNTSTEEKKEEGPGSSYSNLSRRSMILYIIAGAYLAYLGYKLINSVIQGEQGASPIFILAGIAFIAIGVGLLFLGGRSYLRSEKQRRLEEEEQRAEEAAEAEKKPVEEKQEMSIAERARLASRLDEPEETEESLENKEN